jgi:hypothetical protein
MGPAGSARNAARCWFPSHLPSGPVSQTNASIHSMAPFHENWRGPQMVRPASTGRQVPVIQRASSLTRNSAAKATSQAFPSVPSGAASRRASRALAPPPAIGPRMKPGTRQLQRTALRPNATAVSRVSPSSPALAAACAADPNPRRPATEDMLRIAPPALPDGARQPALVAKRR